MENGWVKIHRKIMQNPIYRSSAYVHMWVHLLLKANHKGDKIMWNGGVLEMSPGELITGRKSLSLETGIPESTCESILKFLEKQKQIKQQKNNKFRVITILNWKHYQEPQQQTDSERTTSRQLADTDKNVKKGKNVKNTHSVAFSSVWAEYPRKVGKGAAEKAFTKLKNGDELLEKILSAIRAQKQQEGWQRDEGRFIPHLATWLNQRRWEDEVESSVSVSDFTSSKFK